MSPEKSKWNNVVSSILPQMETRLSSMVAHEFKVGKQANDPYYCLSTSTMYMKEICTRTSSYAAIKSRL